MLCEFQVYSKVIQLRRGIYVYSSNTVPLVSRVRLFATPWTVAGRAPLSMEFSRQEYWSGLYTHTYIFFQITFHYRLLQDIDYNSLLYTVDSYWLSTLCIVVYNPEFLLYSPTLTIHS